jgi:hypothetical protein
MFKEERTTRKYGGALKKAGSQSENVQMTGLKQRWKYEAPKERAKAIANTKYNLSENTLNSIASNEPGSVWTKKKGKYIQQNWKRFL